MFSCDLRSDVRCTSCLWSYHGFRRNFRLTGCFLGLKGRRKVVVQKVAAFVLRWQNGSEITSTLIIAQQQRQSPSRWQDAVRQCRQDHRGAISSSLTASAELPSQRVMTWLSRVPQLDPVMASMPYTEWGWDGIRYVEARISVFGSVQSGLKKR